MNNDILENNRKQLALDMSGGNEYLENALLSMWENNIKVLECSSGSKEDGVYPYITILIDNNSVHLINNVYDEILKYMKKYAQINYFNDERKFILNLSCRYEFTNVLFGIIINTIKNSKNKEFVQNDIVASAVHLINIFSKENKIFRLAVLNDKMFITITDNRETSKVSTEYPDLNDYLYSVSQTGILEDNTYSCDKNSIMSLTRILYNKRNGYQKKLNN